MNTQISGTSSTGTDGVEQSQLSVSSINRERADCAFVALSHPVRLIGRIQPRAGSIHRQAVRARSRFIHTAWRQRSRGTIHLKQMNATTISRRQIDLRRQNIVERRAERPYVSDQWRFPSSRLRINDARQERTTPGEQSRCFQKGTTANAN